MPQLVPLGSSQGSGSVQGLLGSSELRPDRGVLEGQFLGPHFFRPSWSHMHMHICTHVCRHTYTHMCTHPIMVGGPAIPTAHLHVTLLCLRVGNRGKRTRESISESERRKRRRRKESRGGWGKGFLDTVRKDRSDQTSLGNEGAENDLFKKPNKKPGLLGNPEGVQGQGWSLGSQRQPDSPASRAFI